MAYRIAINGYGRIGRCVLRAFYESTDYADMQLVAINDLADIANLSHLTRYDSTHGRFLGTVETSNESSEKTLIVNGDEIRVFNEPNVGKLPWSDLDVDLVMECSGAFKDRATAALHITGGAKKVLFSQPAESDVDATLVFGINHTTLKPNAEIVSNASCTTNCIVPVLKTINEAFKIESGAITTIHSAMNDQPVIDSYHDDDLRKTRSAMQSIIPVGTALAKGIERILPELTGLLEAQAIRVPTLNVSLMDLTLSVASTTNVEEVNLAIREASASLPANVLGFTDEPLASCDFNHDPRSAIVDMNHTSVANGNLIKLFVWFDNEWAYANRMLDVAKYMSSNK